MQISQYVKVCLRISYLADIAFSIEKLRYLRLAYHLYGQYDRRRRECPWSHGYSYRIIPQRDAFIGRTATMLNRGFTVSRTAKYGRIIRILPLP
jgi:uncharacterized protein (DUF4213/DUF364 family)